MAYRQARYIMRSLGAVAPADVRANLTSSANDVVAMLGEVQTHLSHLLSSGLSSDAALSVQQQIDAINSQVQALTQAIPSVSAENAAAIGQTLNDFTNRLTAVRSTLFTLDDTLRGGTLGKVAVWGSVGIATAVALSWWAWSASRRRRR